MRKVVIVMERGNNLGIDVVATGNRIQSAMKKKSYTAKEIAVMMGLSYQSVWKWCKGESIPEVENLLILSRILEVSMDSLVVSFESTDKRMDELVDNISAYGRQRSLLNCLKTVS